MRDGTVVVGLDPGSHVLGACALRVRREALEVLRLDGIKVRGLELQERFENLANRVEEFLTLTRPAIVAIEETRCCIRGIQGALVVAGCRALCVVAARRSGATALLVDPSVVRAAIGIAGRLKRDEVKARVVVAVTTLLRLRSAPSADAADAAAVAIWASCRVGRAVPV